jgi:uncharacterized protein (TIGR02145 family)
VEFINIKEKPSAPASAAPATATTASPSKILADQATGSFSDPRDGKTYKTIKIGTQTWMAENLNISSFRNGDLIPEAKTNEEWVKTAPAWCYYENDPKNEAKYGKLYNWYAMIDPRGLAPVGWHMPFESEWETLNKTLGGIAAAGTKMKSTGGWDDNGNGTNESGFSGFPGGSRQNEGTFLNIGTMGFWWSTSGSASGYISHTLNNVNSYFGWGEGKDNFSFGYSIRCVKD